MPNVSLEMACTLPSPIERGRSYLGAGLLPAARLRRGSRVARLEERGLGREIRLHALGEALVLRQLHPERRDLEAPFPGN